MDLEFILILTVDHTKANGQMENNMEKVHLLLRRALKDKEFGKKEKELNG